MKTLISTLLISIFFYATAYTQEPVSIPEKQGTWSYSYLDDENTKLWCMQYGMTPQEIGTIRNKLDQMVEVLHQNPVMADPKGMDPAVESRPIYPHGFEKHPENYGYIGEMNFRLCPWFNDGGKIYRQTIEPPRMTVFINNIVILRHSAFNVAGPEGEDISKAAGKVNDMCRPMKIKELAPGVILYDYAIVFTRPGKQLYLPCTVGEAYKRLISYYELASKKEPAFGVMLTGIKQEYSTLTPAQLNSQAFFGGMFSGITPEKNDEPILLFNNDFFDRTMPKTAVQMIVFPIDADYFRKETDFMPNSVGYFRIYQFLHSLEVASVAKMID